MSWRCLVVFRVVRSWSLGGALRLRVPRVCVYISFKGEGCGSCLLHFPYPSLTSSSPSAFVTMSTAFDFVKKSLLAMRTGLPYVHRSASGSETWLDNFSEALVCRPRIVTLVVVDFALDRCLRCQL
jgi:hypothetical protein